jgi:hypothetical protein
MSFSVGVNKLKVDGSCFTCGGGGGGGGSFVTETVSLPDNATTRVDIPSTETRGSYIMIVSSELAGGSTATFNVSSAADALAGNVARVTSSPALTDEWVQVDWQASQVPQLYHQVVKTGGVGATIGYTVTIIAIG